ncbi:MAG: Zn-dependent hydrolase [Bacteroidales bacterium]|jgi:hypothetical protein|nr:Zn-dependent hydrolase [Bacteroidales bacterium]
MKSIISKLFILFGITIMFFACNQPVKEEPIQEKSEVQKLVDEYAEVELTADLSVYSEAQKQMLVKLIEVADIMDELFWKDAIGDKIEFLNSISDEATKKFAIFNYGPWDRLHDNNPFIEEYGVKPKGANYYPKDITEEEFKKFSDENKNSWYTILKRNEDGSLKLVWYHEEYAAQIEKAAKLLDEASELAENEGFKQYLKLRAEALRTDDYLASDLAWMDMKTNEIDFVVGPIESYEDDFQGIKAAHSGQILLKDIEWTNKLEHFNSFLQQLQDGLPVDKKYKQEKAATDGDLNAYNVIYYAGDANSGGKNIAINLPNDPRVHIQKGTRKLQLKNVMQAKFDKILIPIADILIADSQRKNIKFEDAFFQNVMFHEVAHGLGIKYTINDKKSVRDVIGEYYSALEEAKADITGLYMVTQLNAAGEFPGKDLMDNYVTFLAGIFRSVRFGVGDAHGKANMLEFYYLQEKGAFEFDETTVKYSVNMEKMIPAVEQLVNDILVVQGNGDKARAKEWIETTSVIDVKLQASLDKITEANISRDIVFKQGKTVLGLK